MSAAPPSKTAAKSAADRTPPPGKMPGETVRTLVSLWLLFHFFGIALALATDTGMGRSALLGRIKRTPILDQYLYALWLDVGYSYRFTSGDFDGDPFIEANLIYADDHTEQWSLLPEGANRERREHYQAVARRASPGTDTETPD